MELPENLTLCRASIHLPGGVRAGDVITIDANDPEMEVYLRKGYLVPTAPPVESVDEPAEVEPAEPVAVEPQASEPHQPERAFDDDEPLGDSANALT